jgi:hypothetical protein
MAKLPTRSDPEALFWRAMRFLLILGFSSLGASCGLEAWYWPRTDWPGPALIGLGIRMWAGSFVRE